MTEVAPPYTDEQLLSEGVSKKDLVTFLQAHASQRFQMDRKLKGLPKNVTKTKTKDQLVDDYRQLFVTKVIDICESFLAKDRELQRILLFNQRSFKKEGETEAPPGEGASASAKEAKEHKDVDQLAEKAKKLDINKHKEAIKYTKKIIKNGDKTTFPQKGDIVECMYAGKLDNGKVFDTNMDTEKKGKKSEPLKFKVGVGKVIRGWDEALLTMSLGESAEIVIQPEWAYGKKGVEGKVPPGSTLTFQVDLISVLGR